jgi:site-specific DNA-methyltransferase (adenine-specific)
MIDAARPDLLPSRLFFCAKATRVEREAGCEQLPHRLVGPYFNRKDQPPRTLTNSHPTVKPLALMRWLVKLVTPPGGLVLDPFTGSGTTGIAAVLEDRSFLGIERESDYVDIACARLTHWAHQATTEVPRRAGWMAPRPAEGSPSFLLADKAIHSHKRRRKNP